MAGASPPVSSRAPRAGRIGRRALPLRLYLVGIVLAALLPVSLAGGFWIADTVAGNRQAYRASVAASARALALAVDAAFNTRLAVAVTVAGAIEHEDGNPEQIEAEMRAAAQRIGSGFLLFGVPPQLRLLLDTRLPAAAPVPDLRALARPEDPVPRAFATGRPQIGLGTLRAPSDRWIIAACAPVWQRDEVVAVLGVSIDLAELDAMLARHPLPAGSVAALSDGANAYVAHSHAPGSVFGTAMPGWIAAAMAGRDSGVLIGDQAGELVKSFGFARLPSVAGWSVVIAVPRAAEVAAWHRSLPVLGLALVATLGLGATLALILARHCLRPIAAFTAHAHALSTGGTPPAMPPASGVAEFETLRRGLRTAAVTLQRRAALARRERELLKAVIESTPDPVLVKGLDGRVQLANAAAGRAYGLDAAAMIGQVASNWLDRECVAKEALHDAAMLRSGTSLTEEHLVPMLGNRVFRISKTPLRAREGGPVHGIVTLMQDTTEQRRSEAELRAAEAEMQHLGRRATVGVMASGLAHELNQPLTAATNYLRAAGRLLEREDARPDRLPVLREAVGAAAEQSLRAGEIVRRLREFLGKRVSVPILEPVAAVVEEGVRLALSGQVPPDLAVVTRLPSSLGSAMLDRVPVQQILVNLVRNAVEAMHGRTRQSLTVAARRVWTERQPWIEISVSDTGPGLPPEVAARLFEPFIGTKPDGLGVGLAICRRFAESQGGRIEAARNADGGMIFTLTLPADGAVEEPEAVVHASDE